jgi:predicted nucleic acid-binding protein
VKPIILDATPLIYLTKSGLGRILEELKEEKITSPQVKREVVDEGKNWGNPDAIILEKMFQNRVISTKEPEDDTLLETLLKTRGLHITDAEVLVIAKELHGTAIVDDAVARKTARIYGISYAGTPHLLMKAIKQSLITKERAKQAIKDMVSEGWRCDIETYTQIMDAIDKL